MTLDRDRPEILQPPEHPQACCAQQAITVPADVPPRPRKSTTTPPPPGGAPTARRTGAERGFATIKDPATSDITRGWCRLMGLAPADAIHHGTPGRPQPAHPAAWNPRQEENTRRAARGLPPKTRKRRRKTHRRAHRPRTTLTATRPRHQHQLQHHDSASHARTRQDKP